jgi:hypothetical protein
VAHLRDHSDVVGFCSLPVEPKMKILQMPAGIEEPFACPIGLALREEYRRRKQSGLTVPPVDLMDCTDPDMMPYAEHVDSCDDLQ